MFTFRWHIANCFHIHDTRDPAQIRQQFLQAGKINIGQMQINDTCHVNFDAPQITVVLSRAQSTVHTTSQIDNGQGKGIFSGALNLADAEPSNQVEAIASADAHFERPWSSAIENNLGVSVVYGNLFNPYWEPHLVPTNPATKAAAQGAQYAGQG